ncbi:MAG: Coenzyme F420 hydrogenase/dehydrogenase, beta subunit C-terminal domain [Thermodesulfobacteriota bacterium]
MKNSAKDNLKQQVIDQQKCTQCGACVNICPYTEYYEDRIIPLYHCDLQEGSCYDICPGTPTDFKALQSLMFDKQDITSEIGSVKEFCITRSSDQDIRINAQHGGTVSTLISLALSEGVIDAAVLAGEQDVLLPKQTAVTDSSRILEFAKSKFVVSPTVAEFNALASKNEVQKIGVVATPCQALALAKMRLSNDPRIQANIKKLKLVIGLFCGWTFSWEALKKVIDEHVGLKNVLGMDIPPSKYHNLKVFTPTGETDISLDDLMPCINPACNSCIDMTAEFSDISVGSARLKEGWETAKSWNHTLVRTIAGEKLIQTAKSHGLLEFKDVPEGNLEKLKRAALNKKENLE